MAKTEYQLAKEIRLLGMTRQEVADKLEVTKQTIQNWIYGIHPINPVGVRKLKEIGIPAQALRYPSERV